MSDYTKRISMPYSEYRKLVIQDERGNALWAAVTKYTAGKQTIADLEELRTAALAYLGVRNA